MVVVRCTIRARVRDEILAALAAGGANKTVVAEGVENVAQFDFLRYQGCHEFQGWLFSRPLPEQEFRALLERGGQC